MLASVRHVVGDPFLQPADPGRSSAEGAIPIATLANMSVACEITQGTAQDISQLRRAFLSLHGHHRSLSAVPITEPDERAWQERVSTYEKCFDEGRALLHLVRVNAQCVGYAFTVLHAGSDDTFPLGVGYAEPTPSRCCRNGVDRGSEQLCLTPLTAR